MYIRLFAALLLLSIVVPTAYITTNNLEVDPSRSIPYLAWTYPIRSEGDLDWNPNSTLLAIGEWIYAPDNLIVLTRDGNLYWKDTLGQVVNDVEWSPSSKYLAVGWGNIVYGSEIGGLVVYRANGSRLFSFGNNIPVYHVKWSRNEALFAASENALYVFTFNGTLEWTNNSLNNIQDLDVSDDGSLVAIGSGERITVLNATDGSFMWEDDTSAPALVKWSPDSERLVIGDAGLIKIYNRAGMIISSKSFNNMYIRALEWSNDGEYIAAALGDSSGYSYLALINSTTMETLWMGNYGAASARFNVAWLEGTDFFVATIGYGFYLFNVSGIVKYFYRIRAEYMDVATDYSIAIAPFFADNVYVFFWNLLPIPVIDYSPIKPRLGDTVVFNATRSYDEDGNITSYAWSINETRLEGPVVEYRFTSYGLYRVTLTVTDDRGASNSKSIYIRIARPPIIRYKYTPSIITAGSKTVFNASESFDPDGYIVSVKWCFGDGTCDTGFVVEHTYTSPGTYNVSVEAVDNDGLTNSTSFIVEVHQKPYILIYADDQAYIYINDTFHGTAMPGNPVIAVFEPGKYVLNITGKPLSEEKLASTIIEHLDLRIDKNTSITLHIPYKPALNITCNVECMVYLNNTFIGEASPDEPLIYRVLPGLKTYNITGIPKNPGYKSKTIIETYSLEPDQTVKISLLLEKRTTTTTTSTTTTPSPSPTTTTTQTIPTTTTTTTTTTIPPTTTTTTTTTPSTLMTTTQTTTTTTTGKKIDTQMLGYIIVVIVVVTIILIVVRLMRKH